MGPTTSYNIAMIYIDVSAAAHSRAGLGRYSHQLARALAQNDPDQIKLFYNKGRNGIIPTELTALPVRKVWPGYKPWRLVILLAHIARLPFNRLVPDADLFHSTEHLLFPLKEIPTVLTVHDLIYKLYPAYHKRLNYWFLNLAMPLFCRRATAIIAVSEATKKDLVNYYSIEPSKIHVVPEAPSDTFRPPAAAELRHVRDHYRLPDRYLIHIGTIEPRKNLSRLVDGVRVLQDEFPGLSLVLVGAKGWLTEDLFNKIKSNGMADLIRHLGWVSEQDLPGIIGGADLAVQPSLYEGFGLPILEHMACGQVVAASNRGSLPEVGGNAAAYFDPLNLDEMLGVIAQLLRDKAQYGERRQLGLHQARLFSWGRAAQETMAVYQSVLNRPYAANLQ